MCLVTCKTWLRSGPGFRQRSLSECIRASERMTEDDNQEDNFNPPEILVAQSMALIISLLCLNLRKNVEAHGCSCTWTAVRLPSQLMIADISQLSTQAKGFQHSSTDEDYFALSSMNFRPTPSTNTKKPINNRIYNQ